MFLEAIEEITRTKHNNSVFKEYGRKFYDLCRLYGQRDTDIKDRQLNKLKEIANTIDVPIDFVVALLEYEAIDE